MTAVFSGTRVVAFDPPAVPANQYTLYEHVDWTTDSPERILVNDGVVFRPLNFGAGARFGVIEADWCEDINDPLLPDRPRPDISLADPFLQERVWASDQNDCGDLSDRARQETRDRVSRLFDRQESLAAELQFGARLATDAALGTVGTAANIVDALSQLEAALGKAGITGFIHLGHNLATPAASAQVLKGGEGSYQTVLGHQLVFAAGYIDPFAGTLLVATTQVYGWRGAVLENEIITHQDNDFYALSQRSVLLGYEKIIAAVRIT